MENLLICTGVGGWGRKIVSGKFLMGKSCGKNLSNPYFAGKKYSPALDHLISTHGQRPTDRILRLAQERLFLNKFRVQPEPEPQTQPPARPEQEPEQEPEPEPEPQPQPPVFAAESKAAAVDGGRGVAPAEARGRPLRRVWPNRVS